MKYGREHELREEDEAWIARCRESSDKWSGQGCFLGRGLKDGRKEVEWN